MQHELHTQEIKTSVREEAGRANEHSLEAAKQRLGYAFLVTEHATILTCFMISKNIIFIKRQKM